MDDLNTKVPTLSIYVNVLILHHVLRQLFQLLDVVLNAISKNIYVITENYQEFRKNINIW